MYMISSIHFLWSQLELPLKCTCTFSKHTYTMFVTVSIRCLHEIGITCTRCHAGLQKDFAKRICFWVVCITQCCLSICGKLHLVWCWMTVFILLIQSLSEIKIFHTKTKQLFIPTMRQYKIVTFEQKNKS